MASITIPTREFGAIAKAQLGSDAEGLTSAQAIGLFVRNAFRSAARQSERQKIDVTVEQKTVADLSLALQVEADKRETASRDADAAAETLLGGIKVS
jgi:hypothetical protein|tara:strand:- start:3302 stop:3592 length:291 start_codon:yes stop_codon:yes gene_type:complete